MDKLVERIKNELFTKTGKINAAILRREWFLKSDLFLDILQHTKFITSNDISERIYCILNGITHKLLCPSCNTVEIQFLTFQAGYSKTCGNVCSRKLKGDSWKSSSSNKLESFKRNRANLFNKIKINDFNIVDNENLKKWIISRLERNSANYIYSTDYIDNADILCSIIKRTEYLKNDNEEIQWSEMFYNIINDLYSPTYNKFNPNILATYQNFKKGYRHKYNGVEVITNEIPNRGWNNYYLTVLKGLNAHKLEPCNIEDLKALNKQRIDIKCLVCNSIQNNDLSDGDWKNIFCYNCNGNPCISHEEKTVIEDIKTYYIGEIQENIRVKRTELDIYIPEFKFGIEYDGILWHSSGYTFPKIEGNSNKHINKTNMFKDIGIQIFHIFSNEWEDINKRKIWNSIIKNRLGHSKRLYARNCEIRVVNNNDKNAFLFYNHLQGDDKANINLGLFYKNELVSVMTFSKPRFDKNCEYELVRFCNKLNTTVIGGASKLLTYFERKYSPKSLVTYADLRRSDGNLYNKLGFVFSHISAPNYFYFKGKLIVKRYKAQKHKLFKLLGEGFNPELTETENMYKNGYRKIFDCGNMIFIKNYAIS